MEILVVVLAVAVIALLAALAFAVIQLRPGGAGGVARRRSSPLGRRTRGIGRRDPMAAAVADHAEAIDPQDVVAAERNLQTQARHVATGLHAQAHRDEHRWAADQTANGEYAGPRVNGYSDPATDPRYDDPRHADPATDPRYVDPRDDDRAR
jgi:hypothetical protein